jgi:hypothetical protein
MTSHPLRARSPSRHSPWRAATLPLAAALLAAPHTAGAQRPEVGVAVGVARAVGSAGRVRGTGWHGALSLGWDTRDRGMGVRLDLAAEQLPGRDAQVGAERISRPTLGAQAVRGSVQFTGGGARVRPYALLGGGSYRMQMPGDRNPYGLVVGVHTGAGARVAVGRVVLTWELLGVLPLTDYGGAGDYQPVTYAPVSVGVRW